MKMKVTKTKFGTREQHDQHDPVDLDWEKETIPIGEKK